MLQICNNSFLFTDDVYKTLHRTPLYTNISIPENGINLCIGKIFPSSMFLNPKFLICEIEERQPAKSQNGNKAIFISTTGQNLMEDLSHVISFFFGGICMTSQSYSKQLLSGEKIAGYATSDFLHKFYDKHTSINQEQVIEFEYFFKKLVNSPRDYYEKSLQAIRRYVTAAVRISDDLDAAYTLFVASIESLTQDINEFEVSWDDVDSKKRKSIDLILSEIDEKTANSIRMEIISHEHLALSRKFLNLAINSLNIGFYNPENKKFKIAGENKLKIAIKNAYNLRSKYIHILKPLPTEISEPHNLDYCIDIDGKPHLTFNGLAAVNREVILKFVNSMPKIEKELLDITRILPGVRHMKLSELYWINDVRQMTKGNYVTILIAVLSRIEIGIKNDKHEIPNMKPIINKISKLISTKKNKQELLTLISTATLLSSLYGYSLDETQEKKLEKHSHLFNDRGIEMLLINSIHCIVLEDTSQYYSSFKNYTSTKYHKGKIKLSEFF